MLCIFHPRIHAPGDLRRLNALVVFLFVLRGVRLAFAAVQEDALAENRLAQRLPASRSAADNALSSPNEEIFEAIWRKDRRRVEELLAQGVPVDVRNADQWTPLMAAALAGWPEMVRFLLERGADVNTVDKSGHSALAHGIRYKEVVQILLERGANPNVPSVQGYPLLIEKIVRERDEEIAKLLVNGGANVNIQEPLFGLTPLIGAVKYASDDMILVLLEKGASVKARDKEGNTALILAARHRSRSTIEALLAQGAEINASNKRGETALMRAAEGNNEVLRLLLQKGAHLEASRENGWTPLICAAAAPSTAGVDILLEAGANVNARSKTGQTALMFAAIRGNVDMLEMLLFRGADVNVKDIYGNTALKNAKRSASRHAVALLRAAGAKE
ncbi:MAG TPA: ankyrin repeat domain-containing protein [Chthonomonadales bacterium]|nr:ankyrin repeat domain-containing protein [Chthonomonadales bacterium]